ncbi:BLUF domain-containing protein [Hymenobacter sp. H14-R3]|uniref:BLUF domain-containing protein n=1 Tax=Hymenobacter sp. H14-R3 TaxID=3046308 RepID=UPI0024BA0B8C|nr:BLUF domain-containing protein [Hymenobacter sp. H14-R3]MDJ0366508.1 BLUF domain-containing protein [Hymenobacter sp. H14-R3]
MGLYHLLYQSQARAPFDTPALTALLHQARAFNRTHHLSGLLLHTPDGRFLQILEGEEAVVRALYYDHIVPDPRHHRCRVLGAGACARRNFADWNMGFRIATAEELHALLGAATPYAQVLFAPLPRVRPELTQLLLDFVANQAPESGSYL